MASTRSKDSCTFGSAAPLPLSVLPTYEDVLKRAVAVKQELVNELGKKNIPLNDYLQPVAEEVEAIWATASLPTTKSRSIYRKLEQQRWLQSSSYKAFSRISVKKVPAV